MHSPGCVGLCVTSVAVRAGQFVGVRQHHSGEVRDATLIAITVLPTRTGGDLEDNSLSLLAFVLEGKAQ